MDRAPVATGRTDLSSQDHGFSRPGRVQAMRIHMHVGGVAREQCAGKGGCDHQTHRHLQSSMGLGQAAAGKRRRSTASDAAARMKYR